MFLARRDGLLAAYPWVDLTEYETTLAVMSTQGGRGRLDAFIWDLHYVCMHDLFGEATTMAEAGLVSSLHPRGGDVVFKADATQEIQVRRLLGGGLYFLTLFFAASSCVGSRKRCHVSYSWSTPHASVRLLRCVV